MYREMTATEIKQRYADAKKRYADVGIDTDAVLKELAQVPVTLHCWQGDDVHGFEIKEQALSGGGIMSTGNYPGCAANGDMLRSDSEAALKLIPGNRRYGIHAIYAETDGKAVSRDAIEPKHFAKWMAWAKKIGISLDFNASYFAHPMADSGYTASSADSTIRKFWIRHGVQCRAIAAAMGKAQGNPCILNHWFPDGAKDQPVDRLGPRKRLMDALDEILAPKYALKQVRDAVESKLFGLASEDYVVGSHEFYMAYVMSRPNVLLTFDMGHFHPTETIHDKVAALACFKKDLLIHVSRGVRWDSDHVVIFNDDLRNLFQQIVRCKYLNKTWLALDFFDGSINRLGAWVVGTRAAQRALLCAMLEPTDQLLAFEKAGDNAMKLALLEELKGLPWEAVYDEFCRQSKVPAGLEWINALVDFDRNVIKKRK